MFKVCELRMNYQKELMAVESMPQFSWILESDARGVVQQGYQLQIAKDAAFENIIVDTGMVESAESAHIVPEISADASVKCPANIFLESATRYFARVRVSTHAENADSDWSEYSPAASFVTGLLQEAEWKASCISPETEEDADKSNGSYLRKEFCVPEKKKVKEAFAFTTAFGLYQLYLNGERVGTEELAPGWTSYKKHVLYQTHDITDKLREGVNAIGVHIGAGWYKGVIGFARKRNLYGKQTAFLGQILVRYEDGTSEWICSEASWKCAPSPVLFSEIYDGEIYDAAKEQPGWNEPGFDDGTWRAVQVCDEMPCSEGSLTAQEASAVQEMECFPAKAVFQTPQGDTCMDFGQNMAGWVHVQAAGKAGDVIELICFETLDAAGNVYLDNLRSAKQTIRYVFGRDGEIEYHPHFTYQGFRYAKLVQFPGGVQAAKKENFTAYALYSDMEETGEFSCSHPELSQFHKNVGWGLRSNFVDVPTDCPQRDERLGWTGDAQIFSRTATYLRNTYSFYEKWLKDVACDQTAEGGVAHVVPDILSGRVDGDWLLSQGTHSAAAWADVAVIMPWSLYLNYGDTKLLEKQYDSMKGWITFMRTHAVDHIWNYKLQFGDWVALDAEEGSYYGATPNDLTCTAYYAYSTGLFAKMCRILGKTEEAQEYQELYQQIVKAFQEHFFDKDGNLTAQTQTAHILALYFHLVEARYREKTAARLKELLAKENGHLVTGFVGTPYFCHALSENGCTKEAYELLLKDDFPSWLYQVKMGATTVWEHWDGMKPDGTMWSADMNSFNHYAYGAVDEWIFRVLGGIDTSEAVGAAGFHRSVLYPHIGGGLTWAKTSYLSPYGKVGTEWEVDGDRVKETFTIPHNTTALIRLFQAETVLEADGLTFEKNPADDVWQAEAGSGIYQISYRMKH